MRIESKKSRQLICRAVAFCLFACSIAYTLTMIYCLLVQRYLDLLILFNLIFLQSTLVNKSNGYWVYKWLVFPWFDFTDYFASA
jgi:hypothetical protein